jgi:actin-related protein 8
MIDIFLKRLAFSKLYMHQESVLASFGVNVMSSCVVDVGSDKINICCVDEGVSMLQTVVRKHFGGSDINLLLH